MKKKRIYHGYGHIYKTHASFSEKEFSKAILSHTEE